MDVRRGTAFAVGQRRDRLERVTVGDIAFDGESRRCRLVGGQVVDDGHVRLVVTLTLGRGEVVRRSRPFGPGLGHEWQVSGSP